MAFQIRTGIIFLGISFYIIERNGFCAILVVEGDHHFIIVQVDGVDKYIDEPLPVILSIDVQFAEFVQPEGDELGADSGLCQLFVGDLDFQILLRAFQFFQTALCGFGEDAHLDCIQDILDSRFHFPETAFQNRQGSVLSVLQIHHLRYNWPYHP